MTGTTSQMVDRDGLIELEVGSDVRGSARFNEDIAPTQASERTWSKWNIAALWVGMSICVPTYTLGGVLTAYFGLSVGEALFAIFLANIIVLIPLTLNAFPGTKFGIPFPVVLRSSFGIFRLQCALSGTCVSRLRLVRYSDHVWWLGDSLAAV